MSAIAQEVKLPKRFNMIGAALLLDGSPFSNPDLGCVVLGDFVNRALQGRCRLEAVGIPVSAAPCGDWDKYFDDRRAASDRHFYLTGPEQELRLGPRALEFLRERLKNMRGYNLL